MREYNSKPVGRNIIVKHFYMDITAVCCRNIFAPTKYIICHIY